MVSHSFDNVISAWLNIWWETWSRNVHLFWLCVQFKITKARGTKENIYVFSVHQLRAYFVLALFRMNNRILIRKSYSSWVEHLFFSYYYFTSVGALCGIFGVCRIKLVLRYGFFFGYLNGRTQLKLEVYFGSCVTTITRSGVKPKPHKQQQKIRIEKKNTEK